MNRRDFVGRLAVGGLAGRLVSGGKLGASEVGEGVVGTLATTPVTVQAPRSDGFEAVWGVSEPCLGRIEWEGPDGQRGVAGMDAHGFVPQGTRHLRVRVSGWRPGQEYRWRAVTVSAGKEARIEQGQERVYRTLNPESERTRFAVWNDTHVNGETIAKLDEVTPSVDFLIWNGDTCNDWHREEDLIPTLLNPGGRDITHRRPMQVTWGNHDVRGPWAYRVPELVASPHGRPFRAFRSGPVAVVCLHTGEDKPDDHPSFRGRVAFDRLRMEQAAWLEEVIQRPEMAGAPYRVVFCHIPLRWLDERVQDYAGTGYDRHSGRSRAAWHGVLVRWKAQVVVSGHTHRPAWLPSTEEFPYGQMVGGGPQVGSATWMEGVAEGKGMRLTVRNLEGAVLHEASWEPLA